MRNKSGFYLGLIAGFWIKTTKTQTTKKKLRIGAWDWNSAAHARTRAAKIVNYLTIGKIKEEGVNLPHQTRYLHHFLK